MSLTLVSAFASLDKIVQVQLLSSLRSSWTKVLNTTLTNDIFSETLPISGLVAILSWISQFKTKVPDNKYAFEWLVRTIVLWRLEFEVVYCLLICINNCLNIVSLPLQFCNLTYGCHGATLSSFYPLLVLVVSILVFRFIIRFDFFGCH